MPIAIFALCVLVGFILGKFFALWFLVGTSIIALVWCIYLTIDLWNGELAFIIAILNWTGLGVAAAVMWLTYCTSVNPNWFGEFMQLFLRS